MSDERAEEMLHRLSSAAREDGVEEGLEWTTTPPDPNVELIGYRFVDVQDDRVVGELLLNRIDKNTLVAVTQVQVWEDGDWRVGLSPSGEVATRVVTDSSAFMMLER